MSISPTTIFLNEDLDNTNELLEEQLSSHFTSEESASCLFDILSVAPVSHSFNSSLLEDIDLDLQCEDENIDCSNDACKQEIVKFTLPTVHSVSGAEYSPSTITTVCYKKSNFIPPVDVTSVGQSSSGRSYPVEGSSLQLQFSIPGSCSEACKSYKSQNVSNKHCVTCRLCSIQFSSKEALLIHDRDKHVKKEVLLHGCIHCHASFRSKKSLTRHFKIHKELLEKYETCRNSNENCVYSCELCPYISKTRALLNYHTKTKHSLQKKIYTCEKCQFSCLQEHTLTLHHQRHENDPKFACDQCGKLFLTMGILKRHAHTHNKTRAFVCKYQHCCKSFNIKSRLTDHLRTVHRYSQRNLNINSSDNNSCDHPTCAHPSNKLYSHLQKADCFNCQYGKQNSNSELPKSGLNMSNDTSVSGLNIGDIYVYDVVLPENEITTFNSAGDNIDSLRNSCSSSITLNNNMIWQKNSTSYSNDLKSESSRSISHNSSLQKNIIEKKFICIWDGCEKKFRDNYNLYVHRCTHTGEMQRACNLCRYRCVQKSAMDAHMRIHDKQKNIKSTNN